MILRLARLFLLIFALALPGLALAQSEPALDYTAWEKVASQAETMTEAGDATQAAFDDIRQKIADWRAKFKGAEDTNSSQISTVKAQIDALGPPPQDGKTEDKAIAQRRKELNDQLAQLQAPAIRATEAASRADAIIANIDKLLRGRQTDKLLRLTPSPLNPINWPEGIKVASGLGGALSSEVAGQLSGKDPYASMRDNAPVIVGLFLVALMLLARGPHWMERLADALEQRLAVRAGRVIDAIVSLGQMLLPLAGVGLLLTALYQTALVGPLGRELLGVIGGVVSLLIVGTWLAGRVFPKNERQQAPFNLMAERRREGRFLTIALSLLVAIQGPLGNWVVKRGESVLEAGVKTADAATAAGHTLDAGFGVLAFPLQVLAGILLFRLGQLLRRHLRNESCDSEESAFRDRLVGGTGNAVIAVAVIAPLLGGIGYVNAANALLWPTAMTLGLIALVLVIHQFLTDFYVLVTQREDEGRESLVPVLIGFVLGVAALPVAALIWGARPADLRELWNTFRSGMSVGGVQISPGVFLTFAIIFVLGLMVTRLVQGALKTSLLPKTRIDKGGQNAIISGIGYLGIFLAAVIAISSAGIDLSSLAIVAGALSVGVGFGLQTIVQNFVSGIILLIERPISEGDWIEVGGQMGIVKAISVRSTRIETFDRTEVIIPNADLIAGQVTNWTRGNVTGRLILPVGVAYGTDTRKVEKILHEVAQNQSLVMMNPEPAVIFTGFGADSLDFEVRVILSDVNFILRVKSEMNHEINQRFAEEGIEIPFAQRDLWLRNPEVLQGRGARPAQPAASEEPPEEPAHRVTRADLGRPQPGEGMEEVENQEDGDGGDR
ncbi:DUF3772 domain-containing protein [Thioclava atlantica]|uniref:Mechanosensitive ion channel family protein n=1 Tax=Thioclava atlantica TaxID=1317124 RepID=A0A085TUZ2_9RHOB|nr:DUF3772 domain-containing protein [Thioclava atlantica]KFE34539.1 mechanosensitive ion channel family protein [Thioclava atlantica]